MHSSTARELTLTGAIVQPRPTRGRGFVVHPHASEKRRAPGCCHSRPCAPAAASSCPRAGRHSARSRPQLLLRSAPTRPAHKTWRTSADGGRRGLSHELSARPPPRSRMESAALGHHLREMSHPAGKGPYASFSHRLVRDPRALPQGAHRRGDALTRSSRDFSHSRRGQSSPAGTQPHLAVRVVDVGVRETPLGQPQINRVADAHPAPVPRPSPHGLTAAAEAVVRCTASRAASVRRTGSPTSFPDPIRSRSAWSPRSSFPRAPFPPASRPTEQAAAAARPRTSASL